MNTQDILEQAQQDQKLHQAGLNYQKHMGFADKWPEYERFKAGDQWPAVTAKTKNLPRPVFNIIDRIESHKVSSVMNEQVKMVFTAEDGTEEQPDLLEKADNFTKFADVTWEQIKQNEINEEVLETASNVGTGIVHYYEDAEVTGGNTVKWKGQMKGEVIDPINAFPGNPQQKDAQKQPFWLIQSRDLVSDVKDIAKKNKIPVELIQQITPDKDTQNDYDSAKHELDDAENVNILIKYWKKDGKIYFRKSASGIVFWPETATELTRYPIAILPWKKRKKSIFGVGDTEGLIPNQKAINFLMAMQVLSVQNTGWPKLLLKDDFIKQQITNDPGEVIIDRNPQPGSWSAQYLNPGNISNHAQMLVDKFMEYTKEVTGATDEAMGERKSSDLNATAIMLLQKAAGVPIEGIKRRFYQFIEDIGRIWEDFWKAKYNTERLVVVKDDDGQEVPMRFRGTDYADVNMNLKIDVGPSSTYSETLMMSSLDKFYEKGDIVFEDYLEFAPKNVVPFKDRLKKRIEERKQKQFVAMLPPEMQGMAQQMLDSGKPLEQVQMHFKQVLRQGIMSNQMGGVPNGVPTMQPAVNGVQQQI